MAGALVLVLVALLAHAVAIHWLSRTRFARL